MSTIPPFFSPDSVGRLYSPHVTAATEDGQHVQLPPADADRQRVMLLLVDPQVDFIHEDGALSVPGAVADTRRTIEWVFRNVGQITAIASSLDSHIPTQIFFPTWWVNPAGRHPDPFTVITGEDVDRERWRPLYERRWSQTYPHKLESSSRKELMIWPYHTLIGTTGHAITPALYEAIAYHAAARRARPVFLNKGAIPKTEHYSLLEPEVKVPRIPEGDLNTPFLEMLATYDLIYVAGQAKSHCVLETVASVMRYFEGQASEIAKWRILTDCMSAVAHPTIDFDALADQSFGEFARQGLTLVSSTDPIG